MNQLQNISNTEVKEILESKGVKPSYQRLSILKYLIINMNHPSVDTIYKSLSNEIPTLSRMTVYNTLNLLYEKGIVSALKIRDNEIIYDYVTHPHAHFECKICGTIYDIELNSDIFSTDSIDDHKIQETQIQLKGICYKCS
jgi:Fe2+ or Zn2+ uptake regulation protein